MNNTLYIFNKGLFLNLIIIIIDFVKQIKSLKTIALIGYVAKCATIRLTTANLDLCITI